MSLFAVALKDHAAPPLAALPFLAGVKDFNRASAREVLRRQPGFLGRALSLEAAGELRASAAAAGFETMLVQEEEVPAPPPPLRTVKIELKGNGLYSTAAGAVEFIPYGEIQLLSAGAFDAPVPPVTMEALKDSLFLKIRASLPGGAAQGPRAGAPRETFFRADLLAGDGRLRLLLEPETLDFSPLGALRSQSSLVNFRTLLGKIAAPAFNAVKNAFLNTMLAGAPLADLKLASAAACEAELAYLLLFKKR
ncbi:MAG: hypothetical protein A2285_04580 [Elusimicrobia bacterium RIFOXYA12_FULL_57_11]|nr:MAG: hypothetical protein A2285_04580 [Elusimicrobia bacterium RIFOXYA12_FULL_57_11]